jgi:hypothetical protein
VPRAILTKPDRLTDAEFALVKRHAADGAVMVADLDDPKLTAIVRHHHERIDGTGYPDALAGPDIPLGARVIAVADTFDAITSTRAYRKPRTHKQALEVLEREAGTQLDAAAVAAFVSYYSAGRSVGFASALATAPQRLLSGIGGVSSGIGASVAPLAQTACGVGGAALIGACIGGPLPAQSTDSDRERAAGSRQLAAKEARADGGSAGGGEADARPREGDRHPRADIGDPSSTPAPRERVGSPRGLEVPRDGSPGNGGGGGSGGGGSGGDGGSGGGGGGVVTVPEPPPVVPELPPVLPDPQTVLEPVTDVLPPVPVPAPVIELP